MPIAVSVVGFLAMVVALVGLIATRSLFSPSPWVVAVQLAATAQLVWARITLGRRSFHASADPTAGGLVTTGPYRYLRHPIYASVCWFAFAGALAHRSLVTAELLLLLFAGALTRMLAEERLLLERCPEYATYAARTKRLIPFVI